MFLCPPCHDESGCNLSDSEYRMSSGLCEHCGKVDICVSCHGYNFSGMTDAEIEQALRNAERGETYSYWLRADDGPWRQVTVEEFVDAERAGGFYNPRDHTSRRPATGGFGSSSGVYGAVVSDSFEELMEADTPGSFAERWGWRGKSFMDAWRARDPEKVETR